MSRRGVRASPRVNSSSEKREDFLRPKLSKGGRHNHSQMSETEETPRTLINNVLGGLDSEVPVTRQHTRVIPTPAPQSSRKRRSGVTALVQKATMNDMRQNTVSEETPRTLIRNVLDTRSDVTPIVATRGKNSSQIMNTSKQTSFSAELSKNESAHEESYLHDHIPPSQLERDPLSQLGKRQMHFKMERLKKAKFAGDNAAETSAQLLPPPQEMEFSQNDGDGSNSSNSNLSIGVDSFMKDYIKPSQELPRSQSSQLGRRDIRLDPRRLQQAKFIDSVKKKERQRREVVNRTVNLETLEEFDPGADDQVEDDEARSESLVAPSVNEFDDNAQPLPDLSVHEITERHTTAFQRDAVVDVLSRRSHANKSQHSLREGQNTSAGSVLAHSMNQSARSSRDRHEVDEELPDSDSWIRRQSHLKDRSVNQSRMSSSRRLHESDADMSPRIVLKRISLGEHQVSRMDEMRGLDAEGDQVIPDSQQSGWEQGEYVRLAHARRSRRLQDDQEISDEIENNSGSGARDAVYMEEEFIEARGRYGAREEREVFSDRNLSQASAYGGRRSMREGVDKGEGATSMQESGVEGDFYDRTERRLANQLRRSSRGVTHSVNRSARSLRDSREIEEELSPVSISRNGRQSHLTDRSVNQSRMSSSCRVHDYDADVSPRIVLKKISLNEHHVSRMDEMRGLDAEEDQVIPDSQQSGWEQGEYVRHAHARRSQRLQDDQEISDEIENRVANDSGSGARDAVYMEEEFIEAQGRSGAGEEREVFTNRKLSQASAYGGRRSMREGVDGGDMVTSMQEAGVEGDFYDGTGRRLSNHSHRSSRRSSRSVQNEEMADKRQSRDLNDISRRRSTKSARRSSVNENDHDQYQDSHLEQEMDTEMVEKQAESTRPSVMSLADVSSAQVTSFSAALDRISVTLGTKRSGGLESEKPVSHVAPLQEMSVSAFSNASNVGSPTTREITSTRGSRASPMASSVRESSVRASPMGQRSRLVEDGLEGSSRGRRSNALPAVATPDGNVSNQRRFSTRTPRSPLVTEDTEDGAEPASYAQTPQSTKVTRLSHAARSSIRSPDVRSASKNATPRSSRVLTPQSGKEMGVSLSGTPRSKQKNTPGDNDRATTSVLRDSEGFSGTEEPLRLNTPTDGRNSTITNKNTLSAARSGTIQSYFSPVDSGIKIVNNPQRVNLLDKLIGGSQHHRQVLNSQRERLHPLAKKTRTVRGRAVPPGERKKKEPRVPMAVMKSIFTHFSRSRVPRESLMKVEEISDKFWKNMIQDLSTLASHAGRSTVKRADVEVLMRRQGFLGRDQSLNILIENHLPLEYRQELIPMARAGNVVEPKE